MTISLIHGSLLGHYFDTMYLLSEMKRKIILTQKMSNDFIIKLALNNMYTTAFQLLSSSHIVIYDKKTCINECWVIKFCKMGQY